MSMSDEAAFKKMQLERLILLALQRYERDTGLKVRGVDVLENDVTTFAQEQKHVIVQVKLRVEL